MVVAPLLVSQVVCAPRQMDIIHEVKSSLLKMEKSVLGSVLLIPGPELLQSHITDGLDLFS